MAMSRKTAASVFYASWFGRLSLVALALILATSGVLAEEAPESSEELEQVTVTGSRIKRTQQQDVATPLTSYDLEELRNLGVSDARDLMQLLTSNAGAQNNADSLSQNYTVGTSNVNLRGLGEWTEIRSASISRFADNFKRLSAVSSPACKRRTSSNTTSPARTDRRLMAPAT